VSVSLSLVFSVVMSVVRCVAKRLEKWHTGGSFLHHDIAPPHSAVL
jgi:hypothetical protein